jgi:hypothetical protein
VHQRIPFFVIWRPDFGFDVYVLHVDFFIWLPSLVSTVDLVHDYLRRLWKRVGLRDDTLQLLILPSAISAYGCFFASNANAVSSFPIVISNPYHFRELVVRESAFVRVPVSVDVERLAIGTVPLQASDSGDCVAYLNSFWDVVVKYVALPDVTQNVTFFRPLTYPNSPNGFPHPYSCALFSLNSAIRCECGDAHVEIPLDDCQFLDLPYPWVLVIPRVSPCLLSPAHPHAPSQSKFRVNIITGSVFAFCRNSGCTDRDQPVLFLGDRVRPALNDPSLVYPSSWHSFSFDAIQLALRSITDFSDGVPRIMEIMNRHCAVILNPHIYVIMSIQSGRRTYTYFSQENFVKWFAHYSVTLRVPDEKKSSRKRKSISDDSSFVHTRFNLGKIYTSSADAYMFREKVFNPIPLGLPDCASTAQFNEFSSIAITRSMCEAYASLNFPPEDEWKCNPLYFVRYPPVLEPMLYHLYTIICDSNPDVFKYVMGFFASVVQRYWLKLMVMMIIKGSHGCGKGFIYHIIENIIGNDYYRSAQKISFLVGQFNSFASQCLFAFCDEMDFVNYGGVGKRADTSEVQALKILITEKTLVTQNKHRDVTAASSTRNFCNLGGASNEERAAYVPSSERRFAIVECKANTSGGGGTLSVTSYFNSLYSTPVLAAAWLLYLPCWIQNFDARAIPQTESLQKEKTSSLDDLQTAYLSMLNNGLIPRNEKEAARKYGGAPPDATLISLEDTSCVDGWTEYVLLEDVASSFSGICGRVVTYSKVLAMLRKVRCVFHDYRRMENGIRSNVIRFRCLSEQRREWAAYMCQTWEFVDGVSVIPPPPRL